MAGEEAGLVVDDPMVFQEVGLVEEGSGADLVGRAFEAGGGSSWPVIDLGLPAEPCYDFARCQPHRWIRLW